MSKKRRRPTGTLAPAVPPRDALTVESRIRYLEKARGLRFEVPKRLPRLYYSDRLMTKDEIARHNAKLPHGNPHEQDVFVIFNVAMFAEPEPVLDPEPNMPPLEGEQ